MVFSHLFERTLRLAKDGNAEKVGLSRRNPITAFAKNPDSLTNALQLDDTVIWGSLHELETSKDDSISQLSKMLKERKLPKAIDLRASVMDELGMGVSQKVIEKAIFLSQNALKDWVREQEDEIPLIWTDSGQRIPYRDFQEDTGPFNQILIRRNGTLFDLKAVSSIVEAIRPYRFDRIYIPFPTEELNALVVDKIKVKSKEAKGE